MAPPSTSDAPDPNALIATILLHLPSFQTKPAIAAAAFQTIRMASQTSSVQQISYALLLPITALSLNSASAPVRSHARHICVLLLRCLVLRRFSTVVAAYVEDVVNLARDIVFHHSRHHVRCSLPNFTNATAHNEHAPNNYPHLAEHVLNLPVASLTLESLLQLLALLIPSSLPLDHPHRDDDHQQPGNDQHQPSEAHPFAAEEQLTAEAVKLWHCLGGKAQAAVLALATSHALLAGHCGYAVARAAVHIWERAFDPAACYTIPPTLRETLCIVVNDVLRDSYPQQDGHAAMRVRAGLYRLCQLSGEAGKIDGTTWSECGIREAVLPESPLALQLRSFSKSGLVHSHRFRTEALEDEDSWEPPLKKRRVAPNLHHSASVAPERTLESGERTQNTASDYHRLTVHGLFKSVKALPSTDVCATDRHSLLLLANACCLTADSVCNVILEGGDHVQSVREWLSFASSLSHIGQDVVRARKNKSQHKCFGAVAIFARACLHLASVLKQVKFLLTPGRLAPRLIDAELVDTTTMVLLSVVVNVLNDGSECNEDSESSYPASQVAELVMGTMNAIQEERIQTASIIRALKTCCERFLLGIHNGMLKRGTKFHVLRAVLKMSRFLRVFQPVSAVDAFLEDICNYISNINSTEKFAKDCLGVVQHLICFKVQCPQLHEVGHTTSGDRLCEQNQRLDDEIWMNLFTALKSLRDKLYEDENHLADLYSCASVFCIHCPRERDQEAIEFYLSFMEKPSVTVASSNRKLFSALLERSEGVLLLHSRGGGGISLHGDRCVTVSEGLPASGRNIEKKMQQSSRLDLEVRDRARKFMLSTHEDNEAGSYLTIFGNLFCTAHQVLAPHIFGPVVTGLVLKSVKELHPISVLESECTGTRTGAELFLDEKVPCMLSAWNYILMTACIATNQFHLRSSGTNAIMSNRHHICEHDQALCQKRTLSSLVCDTLNLRLHEFLPHCIGRLLEEPGFSRIMKEIISEGNEKAFWVRVTRHTVVHLLKDRNRTTLEKLAAEVQRPLKILVERVSADALALSFMTETSGLRLNSDVSKGFILELLGVSLDEIIRKKFGKIVQRLVMEFGGPREASAKHGLVALSAFLPNRHDIDPSMKQIAGVLITSNFMLVMDAVNRGLFNSRTTSQERRRHLKMLEVVLALSADQLHLFVPKVMATLKMALDITKAEKVLYVQTLALWKNFLHLLGPQRLIPHIGTVFAILMPVRNDQGNMLLNELGKVLNSVSPQQIRDKPSLLLLVRIMRQAIFFEKRHFNGGVNEWNESDKRLSMSELHEVCKNVESIIGHHENENIEVHASQYLLSILRSHRYVFNKVMLCEVDPSQAHELKEFGLLVDMLKSMVAQLSKTKSIECQDALIQCIGEIGAIDPSLLSHNHRRSTHESEMVWQSYPKSVHGFAAVLLDEFLVSALRKGEKQESSKSQFNRVGLVIQELLRLCGCNKTTPTRANIPSVGESSRRTEPDWESILTRLPKEGKAILFWESLSSTTRDAVQPYLAEPFDVSQYLSIFGENSERSIEPACQPVWSKVKALVPLGRSVTAQEWTRQMTVQLVDFIGRQGQFGELLRALRPILRYEDQVNNHIFPLVVTTALDMQHDLEMSEVKEFLIREIKQVLTEATSPQSVFDLLDTLRGWRDRRSEKRGVETYRANYSRPIGGNDGHTPSRKRIPVEKFMDIAVMNDPLTELVDLYGKESDGLSLLSQAQAALASRSHHRAIMLAEYHIRNVRQSSGFSGWPSYIGMIRGGAGKGDISHSNPEIEALKVLQQAYANIEDVPNMEGIAKLRLESALTEMISDSEAAGKYDEALATYEHALAGDPRSAALHNGFLSCLMTLGHWETMLSHAEGLVSSSTLVETELRQTAKAHGIAAAWRLGRWEKLGQLRDVMVETSPFHTSEEPTEAPWMLGYTTHFANMLLCFREGELDQLEKESSLARRHLIQPLIRAAKESYHRTYPIITIVHSVCEAEDAARLRLLSSKDNGNIERKGGNGHPASLRRLIDDHKRIQCTSKSLKLREPLLSSRRVLFNLLGLPDDAANAHIALAKLARESGNLNAASASAFRAVMTKNINSDVINAARIEAAHIRRAGGDVSEAVITVKREIERLKGILVGNGSQEVSSEQKQVIKGQLCTALVLAGTWSEETRYETSERILRYYQEASTYGAKREEPFYALGKHFDSLLQAGANADATVGQGSHTGSKVRRRPGSSGYESKSVENHQQYVPKVISSFAKALTNGHKRIFEALPRMLTVWFDFYTARDEMDAASGGSLYEVEVRKAMYEAMNSIPCYMWMTAIPQLMSRILHPQTQVRDELRDLLATIVCEFPDQSFWMILPSSQLKNQERKKATADILSAAVLLLKKAKTKEARERAKAFKQRTAVALNVLRFFVHICITQLPKELRGKKERCAKEFSGLRKMLKSRDNPRLIIPTLQSLTVKLADESGREHRPFAAEAVRIADIEDEVLVMSSLMRPRRISLVGSDGLEYRYLAKRENQGDMRKDSRMVEFLTVVNRLLCREEGSRGKQLELKTYAVLPLSEETGMIEWVNDLEALRNVVRREHNRVGPLPDAAHILRQYENAATKRQFLEEWAFAKFPPVMDRYFVRRFGGGAEARAWVRARNAWTESCAVWSMAGYVVGLGDRHGENVLVESTSGRCVHVDFAMLFDKGLTLKVPEVVPFRLTRNMVGSMGVAGYEGLFRAVAEVVLGGMRRNWEAVVGVLESFLHDPLADWRGGGDGGRREGREMRAAVKAKLLGMVDASGLALSIGGQVERLVQDASSVEKLSRMYIWWAAWI